MNDTPGTFRARLAREAGDALSREIETACQERRDQQGGHADWARLCEEAGLVQLAFREWQLALRDAPDDADVALRLAQYYRDRNDPDRAGRLLQGVLARQPAWEPALTLLVEIQAAEGAFPTARATIERAGVAGLPSARVTALLARLETEPADVTRDNPLAPSEADLVRFQALFSGREDTHARQWIRAGEVGYSPVREPLTLAVLRQHLQGGTTVGVYPIRLDGTSTFFALDLDVNRAALEKATGDAALARTLRECLRSEGLRLLRVLRECGLPPLYEDSGYKGRHYWVFLEQPEAAEVLHQLGRLLLAWLERDLARGLHLEFFPKQAGVKSDGLGNLIKLPLGLHRRTGRRAHLLDDAGKPADDPLAALRGVKRLARVDLYRLIERLKAELPTLPGRVSLPVEEAGPVVPSSAIGPPAPDVLPAWTEADFEADPHVRHLLAHCPVLAELKRQVEQHRRLSHEEQLVLIHSLGHLTSGPQAVNYLLTHCVDVGPEKLLQSQLRGNPVSCASIRKKIGHITRRVACNCTFPQAPDRYPTPTLHVLGLPLVPPPGPVPPDGSVDLARRYGVLTRRREEIQREWDDLHQQLARRLRALPGQTLACPGGRYRLVESTGIEELVWEPDHAHADDSGAGDAGASGGGTAGDSAGAGGAAAGAAGGGA